ncbi:hypothetical protein F5B19DRAFT_15900 [Rostrohypoxylon terebratum]|nr:hypothetical protein F5B19DRAFT_15900 [Rostrohypoxylon terebratum]
MAAAVTTSAPQSDLEKGQVGPGHARLTSYLQDVTCKVIPFCIGFLIVLSIGAILVITLNFHQVIPAKELVVVSIMLLVFFLLFCIGGMFLYHRKHYPPLTKGPNAPDRPPPEHKTLKDRASVIGTLMVGKFKLGKIHHHHHQNEVEPQGVPENPSELQGATPLREHRDSTQLGDQRLFSESWDQSLTGHGMRDNAHSAQLNKKTFQKGRKPQRSPHSWHPPLTPSHEPIPETTEGSEDEQYHTQNDRDSLASQRRDTRHQRTPLLNGDGVSPISTNMNAHYTGRNSSHSLGSQMRGVNRNISTHNGSPRSPQNPHRSESRRSSREYPVPELQPRPGRVHLNTHNTEPLANLVRIPANIDDTALAGMLNDNCLYIINDQLGKLDSEPKETRSGCKCECKCDHIGRSRSRVREPKMDVARETIASPIVSKVHVPQNEDLLDENGVSDISDRTSTSRRPRAEIQDHKTSKKLSMTTSQQEKNRAGAVKTLIESPSQFAPPEFPSLPPTAKISPSHRDPEPFGTPGDRRRKTYFTDNGSPFPKRKPGKGPIWGQPIPARRHKARREHTMTGLWTQTRRPQKYSERGDLSIHLETGYPGHREHGPLFVPPRGSSVGFSDASKVAPSRSESAESCSNISSDYQQHE